MSVAAVLDYRVFWSHQQQEGNIEVQQVGGDTTTFKCNDASEFLAVLTVLQGEKTVFVSTLNEPAGILTTDPSET